MADPSQIFGDLHDITKEVLSLLLVAVFTTMAGRVKRAIRDLNCFFARSRAMETCIIESSSFEDFKARIKTEVESRELHQRRERNGPD